jgi:hypothetical protein
MNDCVAAALNELERADIRNAIVVRGAKHMQVRFTVNGDQQRMVVIPGTPSDRRSAANTRADVRRELRAAGVIINQPKQSQPARQLSRLELLERRVARLEAKIHGGRSAMT